MNQLKELTGIGFNYPEHLLMCRGEYDSMVRIRYNIVVLFMESENDTQPPNKCWKCGKPCTGKMCEECQLNYDDNSN